MSNQIEHGFGGLFDRDTRGRSGPWQREFPESDLNRSAARMFAYVDQVFEMVWEPGYVFLNTIELDVEAGRFPDVVAAYFADSGWDYASRFFVAPIFNGAPEDFLTVGQLTFEAGLGQTARVLALNGGFRWGANLAVGGVQIPEPAVAAAIRLCPFDPKDAIALQAVARFAWAGGKDLDTTAFWLPSGEDEIHRKLSVLS
jgi:hypothetical protein